MKRHRIITLAIGAGRNVERSRESMRAARTYKDAGHVELCKQSVLWARDWSRRSVRQMKEARAELSYLLEGYIR